MSPYLLYGPLALAVFVLMLISLILRGLFFFAAFEVKQQKGLGIIVSVLTLFLCLTFPFYVSGFLFETLALPNPNIGSARLAVQIIFAVSGPILFYFLYKKFKAFQARTVLLLVMTFVCSFLIIIQLAKPYYHHAFATEDCSGAKYVYTQFPGGEPSSVAKFWHRTVGWPSNRPYPCISTKEE